MRGVGKSWNQSRSEKESRYTHRAVVSTFTRAPLLHINTCYTSIIVLPWITPAGFLSVVRKHTCGPVMGHAFAAREHFHTVHAKIVRVRD